MTKEAWLRDELPNVLPPGWKAGGTVELRPGKTAHKFTGDGLTVHVLGVNMPDDSRWLHVTLSRFGRPPSLADLQLVKETFLGPARVAYAVLPPRWRPSSHGISDVLHLQACVTADVLPNRGPIDPAFRPS